MENKDFKSILEDNGFSFRRTTTLSEEDIVSELPMVGLNENGEVIIIPENNPRLRQVVNGWFIIGDYVLSDQQTSEWTENMKNLKGSALLEYM